MGLGEAKSLGYIVNRHSWYAEAEVELGRFPASEAFVAAFTWPNGAIEYATVFGLLEIKPALGFDRGRDRLLLSPSPALALSRAELESFVDAPPNDLDAMMLERPAAPGLTLTFSTRPTRTPTIPPSVVSPAKVAEKLRPQLRIIMSTVEGPLRRQYIEQFRDKLIAEGACNPAVARWLCDAELGRTDLHESIEDYSSTSD